MSSTAAQATTVQAHSPGREYERYAVGDEVWLIEGHKLRHANGRWRTTWTVTAEPWGEHCTQSIAEQDGSISNSYVRGRRTVLAVDDDLYTVTREERA